MRAAADNLESIQYGDTGPWLSLHPVTIGGCSMSFETTVLDLEIGSMRFSALLRDDLAPRSCERLMAMLPYHGSAIHARWSGEALWSPLGSAWADGRHVPRENATCEPKAGEVLLYAGDLSEPELLIPYGPARFACKAGPLAGNPVLTIDESLPALAEMGRHVLWKGAVDFKIKKR
jgi:hypothetical protein